MPSYFKNVTESVEKFNNLESFISNAMISTVDVALDCQDNEQNEDTLKELKTMMLNYSSIEREMKQWKTGWRAVKDDLETQLENCGEEEPPEFTETFQIKIDELKNENTEAQLLKHPQVKDFLSKVKFNDDDTQEDSNENELGDEDIMIDSTNQTQNLLCPITKVEFVDPVKSGRCGHSYSREAILMHIKQRKARSRCPIVGCSNIVSKDDLQPDNAIMLALRRNKRKR